MTHQKVIQSISVPKKIKIVFKLIQFVSKSFATKLAIKLFYKPIQFKRPEREQPMWNSAQKKRVLIRSLQKEIDVLSYGYSKKKVVLVHGWSGRSTQLFMLANKLLEHGYMVISFDAPAHGNSQGKTTSMIEFVACINQLNEEFGPFDVAVGHSLGGMSLFNAIADDGFLVNKLITIGSGDLISDIIKDFVSNLSLKPIIATKMKAHYNRLLGYDINEHSSSIKAEKVNVPVLVVHDTLDGDVAVSCAKNIHKNLKNSSLLITNGLGHTKILRDEPTLDKIIEFINHN